MPRSHGGDAKKCEVLLRLFVYANFEHNVSARTVAISASYVVPVAVA